MVSLRSSNESCWRRGPSRAGEVGAQSPRWASVADTAGLTSAPQGEHLHSVENNFAAVKVGQLLPNVDGELTMSWECPEYLTENFSYDFPVGGTKATPFYRGGEWG